MMLGDATYDEDENLLDDIETIVIKDTISIVSKRTKKFSDRSENQGSHQQRGMPWLIPADH